ncbi:Uncharacterised protein [Staphylococcus epidermidis]|nr:Uncharacterised protein [Staphylococcus epidermidis]
MMKLNPKWLDIGTPLFIITYINLVLFFTSHFKPSINQSVSLIFNTFTNGYWNNLIDIMNSNVLINIFDFFSILISICVLFF